MDDGENRGISVCSWDYEQSDNSKWRQEIKDEALKRLCCAEDIDPDTYDPSYELTRETANIYAQNFPKRLDTSDIDLFLSLVTANSIDYRREMVDASSLGEEEKLALYSLLQSLQTRWDNKEFRRAKEGFKYFGMFGVAVRSVKRFGTPTIDAEKLVRLFSKVCSADLDDASKLECTRECFVSAIRGVRNGIASEILHCIDPFVFPIINGHQGRRNLYSILIDDIPNGKNQRSELTRYVEYCEVIGDYREENRFPFKNYRVFDLVEKSLL